MGQEKRSYNVTFSIELDDKDLDELVKASEYDYGKTISQKELFGCGCCMTPELYDVNLEVVYGIISELDNIVKAYKEVNNK